MCHMTIMCDKPIEWLRHDTARFKNITPSSQGVFWLIDHVRWLKQLSDLINAQRSYFFLCMFLCLTSSPYGCFSIVCSFVCQFGQQFNCHVEPTSAAQIISVSLLLPLVNQDVLDAASTEGGKTRGMWSSVRRRAKQSSNYCLDRSNSLWLSHNTASDTFKTFKAFGDDAFVFPRHPHVLPQWGRNLRSKKCLCFGKKKCKQWRSNEKPVCQKGMILDGWFYQ